MSGVRVVPAGDAAWLVELDDRLDPEVNARAIAIGRAVAASALPGLRDVVSGYRTVTVYVDPLGSDAADLEGRIASLATEVAAGPAEAADIIEVPTRYGGEHGPDLAEVAAFAGCSEREVIERHCQRTYRVYLVGFVPGFPYMGTVDPRIAMPRRDSPRLRVPAGSVGIAAEQTGIYPVETPGGWRLIGRTPLVLFEATREPPCLFEPGARVRFTPIHDDEVER